MVIQVSYLIEGSGGEDCAGCLLSVNTCERMQFQDKVGLNLSPLACSNLKQALQAKRFVIVAANWLLWCTKGREPASNCTKNQNLVHTLGSVCGEDFSWAN